MRRHVFALSLLLSIVLLLVPLATLSCVPPAASSPAPTDSIAYKSDITALQGQINTKANQSDLVSQVTRIDAIAGQGAANTYPKSELYTKAEVDAKVAAAIAALKEEKPWGTSSTSDSRGATGQVTWVTNPSNIQTLGSQQVCYTFKISNTTSQWVYVRPIININLHTGQSPLSTIPTCVPAVTTAALSGCTITISIGGSAGNFVDSDFQVTGTASSAILIPTTMNGVGSGEMQIGAGITADVLVCITITHPDARIWDIASSVNWRSL